LLEKARRLRKNAEFKAVYRYGRAYSNEWMVLRFIRHADPDFKHRPARVGVSVSKKVGGAVVRNKIKRRILECLYHWTSRLAEGSDLVFIARVKLRSADFWQIREAVFQLLRRANLITDAEAFAEASREETS
jgi:ribonuclease P protein component